MKLSKTVQAGIGAIAISFISAVHSFAIEGIQLSMQSSNVLLSWPSATNETYIVQSLQVLATTDTWTTLTDLFPAALNTNLTVFVASNGVQPTIWITNTSGGGTNSGGMIPPGGGTNGSDVSGYSTGFYRVVRDGVHVFGLTNGMVLSGDVQQPIEFAVDVTDDVVGVTFYDTNENPVIGAHATPGPGGGWILNWNTTMSPNGNYAVEAELDFAGNNDPVVSVPVTVTVSNLISFPNYLTQLYGSQMWIYAQTIPNADVEIDIYNQNTNYLGSFYPVSDGSGVISFTWDLTDGNGHTFTDTNFLGVWTVDTSSGISQRANLKSIQSASPNFPAPITREALIKKAKPAGSLSGGSTAPTVTVWMNEAKWSPNDYWVVGVADMGSQVPYEMVYGGTTSPNSYLGVIGTLGQLGAHIAPGASYDAVFNPEQIVSDSITRSNLLGFLASQNPRYENFFWFGHGSEYSIQAIEKGTVITQRQLALALNNGVFVSSGTNLYGYAQHPYRFTWIEACDTAQGSFCEAFAIPAQNLSTNNFIAGGIMSRAYLGYKNVVTVDLNPSDGIWQARSTMYSTFLQYYLQDSGYSLAALVYFAQRLQGPFSQNTSYFMDGSATSYGATDMLYSDLW